MPFDFAKAKSLARRTVHQTLGVRAFYQDDSLNLPVEIRARWHNRLGLVGDLDNQGYAEMLQGIDRVIFNVTEARAVNVKRGGTLSIEMDIGGKKPTFSLQNKEPTDGPENESWEMTFKGLVP